jgi:aminoglycoside 2''-phosphotransferase
MKKQEAYLQSIQKLYPDLDIASVEFNAQGQNSDVVVINREFIFRFPKYFHVLERLKTETAILKSIQGYVPLPVPAPMFLNLDQEKVGEAFVGYRLIPGEPLRRELFWMIDSKEVIRRLASQVAAFLRSLHSVVVEEALRSELPVHDTYEESADIYARIREKLFGYMRPDAREWATGHFEGFLNDVTNFEYEPVLKHGDFGPSNILFDKEKKIVTGVIDFGSSGMGDPAYDFAGLLSGYGEGFIDCCGDVYSEVKVLMRRIRFYQGTFALLEALFGVENGDEEAFEAGLKEYV